jgi:hypothetical protein
MSRRPGAAKKCRSKLGSKRRGPLPGLMHPAVAVRDHGGMTVDNRAPFLVELAEDVIEHVECDGCKVNAAMGLAALGLLDQFLEQTGNLGGASRRADRG